MNSLDIGLALLEGLALIVSPCILPVLPLVLGASVEGGRRRPYGIIIGFVVAFSAFAILARKLVLLLGIDLDLVKNTSLILLALFGLILLSKTLSDHFGALMSWAANLGNRLAAGGGEGLFTGIIIGALIGLVWTPCAGPILATVLVQVIRQETDLAGNLIILSFALGAGIPMLIISIFGRKAVQKMSFFTRHAEGVRKGFGILILLSVFYIASGVDAGALLSPTRSTAETPASDLTLQHGLDKPYLAPELTGLESWINSPPLTIEGLKGKVVLIDFWTYSCINCIRTLPHITEWDRKYRDQGLVIIGVHSPEFEFEKKLDNVRAAVAKHGIRYPVALDNHFATWDNYHNRYWPAHYLIDRDGRVVYTHFGEGKYDVTENNIRYLLGLKSRAENSESEGTAHSLDQTPETYLGYARAASFAGTAVVNPNTPQHFRFPHSLPEDGWALNGQWRVESERIVASEAGASLRLNFKSSKVFLVLGSSSDKPIHLTIRLNGQPIGTAAGRDVKKGVVTVERNTLYELVEQQTQKRGLLEIQTDAPGLEAYAFTFG